jgi:hypothetical protein
MLLLLLAGGCAAPTTAMVECPASGCPTPDPPNSLEPSLREHAAFDFQCPQGPIAVKWIDDNTAEASGCGHGARYAYVVTRFQSRWLLDSPVVGVAAK